MGACALIMPGSGFGGARGGGKFECCRDLEAAALGGSLTQATGWGRPPWSVTRGNHCGPSLAATRAFPTMLSLSLAMHTPCCFPFLSFTANPPSRGPTPSSPTTAHPLLTATLPPPLQLQTTRSALEDVGGGRAASTRLLPPGAQAFTLAALQAATGIEVGTASASAQEGDGVGLVEAFVRRCAPA